MKFALALIIGSLLTLLTLVGLRRSADKLGLFDLPGGHKTHTGSVPIVGGIAIWLGFLASVAAVSPDQSVGSVIPLAILVIAILGVIDDRITVSPVVRLTIQFSTVAALIIFDAIAPTYLGAPFGGDDTVITSNTVALLLGVILVAGMINAFNMADGMDGLAGSLGLVSLGAVGFVAWRSGDEGLVTMAALLMPILIVFLIFNAPLGVNQKLRTFMGDCGSMTLGLFVGWALLRMSQNPEAVVAPVTLLWFVAVPIFDMVHVIVGRVVNRRSPFNPDRSHFHHVLQGAGLSPRGSLGVLIAAAIVLAVLGSALEQRLAVTDSTSLSLFVLIGVLVSGFMRWLDRPASTGPAR